MIKVNFEGLSLLEKIRNLLDTLEDTQTIDLLDKLAIVTEIRSLLSDLTPEETLESIINETCILEFIKSLLDIDQAQINKQPLLRYILLEGC